MFRFPTVAARSLKGTTMTRISETLMTRREMMKLAAAGVVSGASASWFRELATASQPAHRRARACILLWMAGGPSQTDTFDMKPGTNQRRRISAYRDQCPRHPDLRASAATGSAHGQARRRAQHVHRRGGPRARQLSDADRVSPGSQHLPSAHRLDRVGGDRPTEFRVAEFLLARRPLQRRRRLPGRPPWPRAYSAGSR